MQNGEKSSRFGKLSVRIIIPVIIPVLIGIFLLAVEYGYFQRGNSNGKPEVESPEKEIVSDSSACIVPNLTGLDKFAAEKSLRELGLRPIESNEYSDSTTSGAVISQNPLGLTRLDPCDGEVLIIVSLGVLSTQKPPSTFSPSPIPTNTPTSVSKPINTPTDTPVSPTNTPTPKPTNTPKPPTVTSTPVTPAQATTHTCVSSGYQSLGNRWVSPATFIPVAQGSTVTLSHCPPASSVQYSEIAVDDEILKVEKVCSQSTTDITVLFEKFTKSNKILPYYRSARIDLEPDCRIDFIIKDTAGENAGLVIEGSQP